MISVIIPTLNEECYLKKLLHILSSQEGIKLDVIVADAGSKDNTLKIAKEYGARIVKGGLPAVGRNKGAKSAKYQKLLFLDADVEFPKDFIKMCLDYMQNKKLDVASIFTKPNSKKSVDKILFGLWNFWVLITEKIFPHAPGYCIFSNKDVHNKIKGFDPRISIGEDANYVLKASKIAKFGIIPIFITTSVRRLNTEGRWGMFKKMIYCGTLRIFGMEATKKRIEYKFGKHKVK
jgi:glycosyltransferase involved in cell wall biosynthesis